MWVPILDSVQAQWSGGILGLQMMVLMVSGLGLTHCGSAGLFYEPIYAQDMNSTT